MFALQIQHDLKLISLLLSPKLHPNPLILCQYKKAKLDLEIVCAYPRMLPPLHWASLVLRSDTQFRLLPALELLVMYCIKASIALSKVAAYSSPQFYCRSDSMKSNQKIYEIKTMRRNSELIALFVCGQERSNLL